MSVHIALELTILQPATASCMNDYGTRADKYMFACSQNFYIFIWIWRYYTFMRTYYRALLIL